MNDDQENARRKFAKELAQKLLMQAQITEPPVILNIVVKELRKTHPLRVKPWDFGKKASGMQIVVDGAISIGYNITQHVHRQRFTVAHEIGHFLLGHSHKGRYDGKSRDPQEVEADTFASELLIPISMLTKNYESVKEPKLLAEIYNVSEQAMWLKLMDSKLI